MSQKKKTKQKAVIDLFILDQSSSMSIIKNQIIEGFNKQVDSIIKTSKKIGVKALAGLTYFDSGVDIKFLAEHIDSLPKLNDKNYYPRGCTAMYDAIALSVKSLDEKLGGTLEDYNVVVTVLTDGQENSSTKFTGSQVSDLIKEYRENYGWTFNFIGANIDVENLAETLNISKGNTLSFVADEAGTRGMMESYSISRTAYMASVAKGEDVSDIQNYMVQND